jgi:hypothetical protein
MLEFMDVGIHGCWNWMLELMNETNYLPITIIEIGNTKHVAMSKNTQQERPKKEVTTFISNSLIIHE